MNLTTSIFLSKDKWIDYACLGGLFILLKLAYIVMQTEHVNFLLLPTNWLIERITNQQAVYSEATGYFYEGLQIVIDRSCSGFNFMLIAFMSFAILAVNSTQSNYQKLKLILLAGLMAYLLTVLVNTARIFLSIRFEDHFSQLLNISAHTIHECIGIATNLTFLVLASLLFEKSITQSYHHA